MISQATIAKYLGSELISTPFGKYSRTMRLRFSLLPRSHGECGWAKYTGSPVAVMSVWRAISEPQSQVIPEVAMDWCPPVDVGKSGGCARDDAGRPVVPASPF